MENISLEQIDQIMARANVTYADAKAALEQANGDTVEALLILEKENKIKDDATTERRKCRRAKFKNFIHKLNESEFILSKDGKNYLDIPLSIALLFIICCFYISVFGIIAAYIFGFKINVKGNNDVVEKINQGLNLNK